MIPNYCLGYFDHRSSVMCIICMHAYNNVNVLKLNNSHACIHSFRKDSKLYVACYKELSEKLPGPPTALLLGDAYMRIQEVGGIHSIFSIIFSQ